MKPPAKRRERELQSRAGAERQHIARLSAGSSPRSIGVCLIRVSVRDSCIVALLAVLLPASEGMESKRMAKAGAQRAAAEGARWPEPPGQGSWRGTVPSADAGP